MMRLFHLVLTSVASLIPLASFAQGDTITTYDASALRVESHLGDFRIVRGAGGASILSIGAFHKVDLVRLVARSENAAREAREFERNQRPGAVTAMLGGLILGVSFAVSTANKPTWGSISAQVVGSGLLLYGGVRLNRAYNALSRSIWWYNRDLKS